MTVSPQAYFERIHHLHYKRILHCAFGAIYFTVDYTPTVNRVYLAPFQVRRTLTVSHMVYARGSGALAGGEQVRLGIYADGGDTPAGGALLRESGAVAVVAGTAIAQVVPLTASIQLTPGLYWGAIQFSIATANITQRPNEFYSSDNATLAIRIYTPVGFAFTTPCPAVTASSGGYFPEIYMQILSMP